MRVAVIGAGLMGGKHAQLLAGIPGVTEVLVVDADPARAEAVARDVAGRAMDRDAALDTADAAIIATPAHLHAEALEAAIARSLAVLCEKPLTDTVASSAALVERIETSGAHVEMGFQRRHDPGFVASRDRLADAGPIHLVRLTAFDPRVEPADFPPSEVAPIFLHSSVHDFDFVRWITRSEVLEVTADGSTRDGGARPDDPRRIESAVVTMRLESGALAVLEASWLHPAGYDIRAEVLAHGAHLTMGLSPRTPAQHADWDSAAEVPWPGFLERFEAAYRAELIAFLAAARGEQGPASSARDGLEALRVAVAATRSYTDRRTVALSEV